MILILAHSGTNYKHIKLKKDNEFYIGHLDNYVSVYLVMKAYFSGHIDHKHIRFELTYGEETDFERALEITDKIGEKDLTIIFDVTVTPTKKNFVIEKYLSPIIQHFIKDVLKNYKFDLNEDYPDSVSDQDEVAIYKKKTNQYFFLGLPCEGRNYNLEAVRCKIKSDESVLTALIDICKNYNHYINLLN